jgi:DNA polymerase-2
VSKIQQGFLLTRHSQDTQQHTAITLWVSTNSGPAKLHIQYEQPTFFVRQQEAINVKHVLRSLKNRFSYKNLSLNTFEHRSVAGLYFSTLRDFFEAQKLLNNHGIEFFEHDLRLHDRFLMERFVYGSCEFTGTLKQEKPYLEYHDVKIRPCHYLPTLNVISLDIECAMNGELYSIGLYGEYLGKTFQKVLMIGSEEQHLRISYIEWVSDEKALINTFIQTIMHIDPDIIIGWSVVNFDFRLLMQRAEKHRIAFAIGRDNSTANWRNSRADKNQGFINIAGRVVIDGIDALKTATYSFTSFSLENVAQQLLGKGKKVEDVESRLEEINHNFLYNKQQLAEYNLQDCILVWEIFAQTRLIDFLLLRSQLTGLELDKQGGSVAAFTNLYLPHLHRAGYIAPNLPEGGGLASPGGYVMRSKPGLYHNVIVLDFKSLYPSIIRTFKIDPLGLIEGIKHPENAIPGFRGALFSREKHFLPNIIEHLWQQRDEAKIQKDAARSQAIKIIMNSFYGVLGSGGCRFYDTRLASSITLRGHEIMQQTAEWIEDLGYEVIYGDTDSTFILLPESCSLTQVKNIAIALRDEINDNWQHKLQEEYQLECHLEIEFDNHFSRFLMPTIRGSEVGSKKRYAGLIQREVNGSIEEETVFKGLETVRTDWTKLAKNFQRELFDYVFHDKDPMAYIQQTIAKTLAGEFDEQLVYHKRLRQPLHLYTKNVPPHVKAARLADEKNTVLNKPLQYQNKGWIRYVMTTLGPEAIEYQENTLDYEHYIEKQLRPIAEAILPFIDIHLTLSSQEQFDLF